MDGDTRPRPSSEGRYEILYRLLVIAALAVIMVSLVGIASMTGLLPRVGDGRPNTEAIPDKRGNGGERPQPAERQPSLKTVPVHYTGALAMSDVCGDSARVCPLTVPALFVSFARDPA